MTAIKICGITRIDDAEGIAALGVDAIGLNFWPNGKRLVDVAIAREIVARLGAKVRVVAVVVDASLAEIGALREATGIRWVQLHGDEDAAFARACSPGAYQAVRAAGEAGWSAALRAAGTEVLLDASVRGEKGGTGVVADWALGARIARVRPLWLAGGLTPANVGEAVRLVRPMGVDCASGVERVPGVKDLEKVAAFVRAVRRAE